jgi:hypothetical protein
LGNTGNPIFKAFKNYNNKNNDIDSQPYKKQNGCQYTETEINIKLKLLLLEFPGTFLFYHNPGKAQRDNQQA